MVVISCCGLGYTEITSKLTCKSISAQPPLTTPNLGWKFWQPIFSIMPLTIYIGLCHLPHWKNQFWLKVLGNLTLKHPIDFNFLVYNKCYWYRNISLVYILQQLGNLQCIDSYWECGHKGLGKAAWSRVFFGLLLLKSIKLNLLISHPHGVKPLWLC